MDNLTTTSGIAGGSGLIGILLGYLGFKARVRNIERDIAEMHKNVRYDVTCDKIVQGLNQRFDTLESLQKESRDTLQKLFERK